MDGVIPEVHSNIQDHELMPELLRKLGQNTNLLMTFTLIVSFTSYINEVFAIYFQHYHFYHRNYYRNTSSHNLNYFHCYSLIPRLHFNPCSGPGDLLFNL